MTTPLPRLPALAERANRRREPRGTVSLSAILAFPSGRTAPGILADVSLHGCSIRTADDWLRPGSFVKVGFDEESMLGAIVRWVRDGAAGMEFIGPVPAERREWHAIAEHSLRA